MGKGIIAQNNSWGCDYYSFGNLQQDKAKFSSQSYESILDAQMQTIVDLKEHMQAATVQLKLKILNALDDFQKQVLKFGS